MQAQEPVVPAWLVVMGINDWEVEKILIEREYAASGRSPRPLSRTARTS